MKSNGQVTNWRFCWRCERAIPEKNSYEIASGVHNRCHTDNYRSARPVVLKTVIKDDGQTQSAFVQLSIVGGH